MANGAHRHGSPRHEPLHPTPGALNTKLSGVCTSFWKSLVHSSPGPPHHSSSSTPQQPQRKMLSSSDAKWRCMWHMLIWSVSLTLVSQFLHIKDHIAFYILAAISMIVLPMLTAVYNNTSGKHGAELLRVGYVICDPVIACITVTPLLIFNRLPSVVAEYNCLRQYFDWNATYWCLQNQTDISDHVAYSDISEENFHKEAMERGKRGEFVVIQGSVFVPALLCLFMGARSRKMTFNTHLLAFIYWLLSSIEAADLLEYTLLHDSYKHVIYTTEAILAIIGIITHSYAVVTLCSYINPMRTEINREFRKKFDFIYQAVVAISGVLFTEIPLVAARVQILVVDITRLLPGPFYMWLIKDVIFIVLLITLLLCQKIGRKKSSKMLCTIQLDTPNVVFQPEKRDAYIVKKKSVRFKEPLSTTYDSEEVTSVRDKKPSILPSNLSAYFQNPKSVSHDSGLDSISDEKNEKKKARRLRSSSCDPDDQQRKRVRDNQSKKVTSNPELAYSENGRVAIGQVTIDMESDINENCEVSAESLA